MSRKIKRRVKIPHKKYYDAIDGMHNIVATHLIKILQQHHNTYFTKTAATINNPAFKASYSL